MTSYRGRFAPSPTGELHFGSLFAAVISYLDARKSFGSWIVRIEDIDPLREQKNASEKIVESLRAHGLNSDQALSYQSKRSGLYERALSRLSTNNTSYYCPCSRKHLALNNGQHSEVCISGISSARTCATKFKLTNKHFNWDDCFLGHMHSELTEDFVLKRKEGYYAYQLAVVCDDIDQEITHVIRGADLTSSTPMQLALYHALASPPPIFGHFPLITNEQGQKLSKQNLSQPISNLNALENLLEVFNILGILFDKRPLSPSEALSTATPKWNSLLLPNKNITNHYPPVT